MKTKPSSTALDRKTVALGKTVFQLRQDIDLHRIIGLNASALRTADVSTTFFGHVQRLALTSLAVNLCKIFEFESRHPLCSIPAILNDLPHGFPQYYDRERFQEFALKHHGDPNAKSGAAIIRSGYEATRKKNEKALERLRKFRNKIAVHLEFDAALDSLPSHNAFEDLWTFAHDTYEIVHDQYNRIGPAMMRKSVLVGLRRTFEQLGVKKPTFEFKR